VNASPTLGANESQRRSWTVERLFEVAQKDTVIRLRWPLVILSSYLLYYVPNEWLTPTQVQAILILYLLSHSTLYFISDRLFDSPYFYGPLLLFDTLVLVSVLSSSGTASPDFYIACFLTLVLSCICNTAWGLLVVTFLAPLIYGYFLLYSFGDMTPDLYLRLPFPFIIPLFYGYFAHVERIRREGREKDEQVKKEQQAAEEIRRQRERLDVLCQVNTSIAYNNDTAATVASFVDTTLLQLPYAAALVRLRNRQTGALETAVARGFKTRSSGRARESLTFTDRVAERKIPLAVENVFVDVPEQNLELFRKEGLVSFVAVPLIANGGALGYLVFLTREEHEFGEEEVNFVSTLAGELGKAIQHAELFQHSQRQADELRSAHRLKSEFLKIVSAELKAPLSVIAAYMDMFSEGRLGTLTPIQEKAVETITGQYRELQRLSEALLHAGNVGEGPPVDLRETKLWEFLSELRLSYDGRPGKAKLSWSYPNNLPSVWVDRGKLKQVLEHLIDGAVKSSDGGTLTISARYQTEKSLLELTFTHAGSRIPQSFALLEQLKQAESADSWLQHGGTGLGLYIMKKYLDLLDGKIMLALHEGSLKLLVPARWEKPAGREDLWSSAASSS